MLGTPFSAACIAPWA